MPQINCNDVSWEPTWLSLYGWIYPSSWAKSDAELKNEVFAAYREASNAMSKLGKQTGDVALLVGQWKATIKGYGRTITYPEAPNVILALRSIARDANNQVEVDRALNAQNKRKEQALQASSSSSSIDDADEIDDARLAATFGHSQATATTKPSKVKPKPQPVKPASPQDDWKWEQKQMATQCDNTIQYGTHDVDQQAVTARLQLGSFAGVITQFRPGPENSHIRIIKAGNRQFWTKGLTHQQQRNNGNYMVYERDGAKEKFSHVSGTKHPKEYP